ncbi:MAG: PA0069 family radical SAM protein [Myxococcota bacterium]
MRPIPVDNPPNPWSSTVTEYLGEPPPIRLQVYRDDTRNILSENDSPDVGFRFSVNPYRGCYHACAYCYARPTHEYLSFGAGTDFERRIVIKPRAAELLREAFERPSWRGELITFSGDTDCYQPLEASYELTRACLKVCAEYRNPVAIITKSPLIERDVEVLQQLHRDAWLHVFISVPIWNEEHARAIEPYVAPPRRRMETVRRLNAAGLPVSVNMQPVIPGLGDRDIVHILEAAAEAGAFSVNMGMLRLPGSVKEVFVERLRENLPLVVDKVLGRVRDVRGGRLNDPRFGNRFKGEGEYASSLFQIYDVTARKLGLRRHRDPPEASPFRRPTDKGGQLRLL